MDEKGSMPKTMNEITAKTHLCIITH